MKAKGEDITESFFNSIERVFNFIRFIDKKYIRLNPSRDYKKICK